MTIQSGSPNLCIRKNKVLKSDMCGLLKQLIFQISSSIFRPMLPICFKQIRQHYLHLPNTQLFWFNLTICELFWWCLLKA